MSRYIIETTEETKGADRSGLYRRILAAVCVVCLAAMQCFLLMPAMSGNTFASDKVNFEGTANGYDGSLVTEEKSISLDKGESLKKHLKVAGVSVDDISTLTIDGEDPGADYDSIIFDKKDGDKVWYYKDDPETVYPLSSVSFEMNEGYNPVTSVSINAPETVKGGETITLKSGSGYTVKGDSFFKKNGYSSFIAWTIDGAKKYEVKDSSVKITAGDAGTEIYLFLESANDSAEASISVEASDLTVSPSSVSIYTGESKKITVKDGSGKLKKGDVSWKSSNTKIATVSSEGKIKGVKAGKCTVTVTSKAATSKGKKAKVSVTVLQKSTTTRYTSRPYRPTTGGGGVTGTKTSTQMTTATRPGESTPTETPSFQTITVKEVFLTEATPMDPYGGVTQYDENGNPTDDSTNDLNDLEEDNGVTFPAAAGSAAVAVAACGAGVVGRVRRFKFDMSPAAAAAAVIGAVADDGKRKFSRGRDADAKAGPDTAAGAASKKPTDPAGTEEKKSRNPLKKFRK